MGNKNRNKEQVNSGFEENSKPLSQGLGNIEKVRGVIKPEIKKELPSPPVEGDLNKYKVTLCFNEKMVPTDAIFEGKSALIPKATLQRAFNLAVIKQVQGRASLKKISLIKKSNQGE